MTKCISSILSVSFFVAVLSGCGTIKHGTSQDLMIQSSPSGAMVMVNGKEYGKTPVSVSLSRKTKHTAVTVTMPGYQSFQTALSRKLSGWSVLGGPIGLLIDDATGGMYKLSPDQLNVQLMPTE
ncbi:MAG: PEGA domain-containing protein [Rhodothermaceae bacterium]|nr:PEGA domain-containing protein [Rhodothermaceae bacterium]